jgi:hypothetical protein
MPSIRNRGRDILLSWRARLSVYPSIRLGLSPAGLKARSHKAQGFRLGGVGCRQRKVLKIKLAA